MHELGVVFHIIDDLKAVASDNDVSSISKVTIELGEVSGVVEEYLTDCWKWACKKEELVKDCEMEVEIIPGITYCEDCGETFVAELDRQVKLVRTVAVSTHILFRVMSLILSRLKFLNKMLAFFSVRY